MGAGTVFGREMLGRALILAAFGAAALCAWVAAPALSLEPYQPRAEDFEQRLPAVERLPGPRANDRHADHDGPGHKARPRWITPPIEAPDEFDFVGVAGEMRPLEIRVRDGEEGWSEWVGTHSGDPVYVAGADGVQVRAEHKPEGKLHYVNVSGSSGGLADRVLNSARGALNEAFISVASSFVAEAAPKPKGRMVSRRKWGAEEADGGCQPRSEPSYGAVRAATVHHTVSAMSYSKRQARSLVLGICRFHVHANGWDDIGYHALVDRFGRLYAGRAGGLRQAVVGAHAQGFNDQTTSIASIGTHKTRKLNRKAKDAVIKYLAWKLSVHGLGSATKKGPLVSGGGELNKHPAGTAIRAPRVHPHRRLSRTACPGNAFKRQIHKGISRPVNKRIKRFR